MFDQHLFDDISKRLTQALPDSLETIKADMQHKFHAVLQATFSKLDLVSREEFDVQTKVLARTRAKLEEMSKQLQDLENKLAEYSTK